MAGKKLYRNEPYLIAFADQIPDSNEFSGTLQLSSAFCNAAKVRGLKASPGGYGIAAEITPDTNISFQEAGDILQSLMEAFQRPVVLSSNRNEGGEPISLNSPTTLPDMLGAKIVQAHLNG